MQLMHVISNIRFILVSLGQHLDGAVLLTTTAAFLPQAFRAPGLRRCLLGARSCAAHAQSDCQQNVWLLVEPLGSVGTTVLIRRFEEFRIP